MPYLEKILTLNTFLLRRNEYARNIRDSKLFDSLVVDLMRSWVGTQTWKVKNHCWLCRIMNLVSDCWESSVKTNCKQSSVEKIWTVCSYSSTLLYHRIFACLLNNCKYLINKIAALVSPSSLSEIIFVPGRNKEIRFTIKYKTHLWLWLSEWEWWCWEQRLCRYSLRCHLPPQDCRQENFLGPVAQS